MTGDEGVEVARITITRVLLDDGEDTVRVDSSDRLTLLDALGMLTFATMTFYDSVYDDDDEQAGV